PPLQPPAPSRAPPSAPQRSSSARLSPLPCPCARVPASREHSWGAGLHGRGRRVTLQARAAPSSRATRAAVSAQPSPRGATTMPKCPRCQKEVYFAEKVTSLGKDWHRPCLKCEKCNKTLTSGGHAEHDGKPYCNQPCYSALFGPKGFGRGGTESHTFK
uniref:LIM zinc-binding domain-containing protein n=4 Tax=Archelosauria TaxID=1329799 RepID=A0A452IID7_9SAUR